MFCPQCGKKIPDDAMSCPACGAPLRQAGTAAAASDDAPKPTQTKSRVGRVRARVVAIVVLVVALVAGGTGFYFWQREQNAVWVPTSFKIEGQGESGDASRELLYQFLPAWFPYPSVSWTNRYAILYSSCDWDQASFELTDGGAYESCDASFGGEEVPLEVLLDDYGNYVGVRNTDTGEEFKGSYTYDDQGRPLTYKSDYTSATFSYADDGSYQLVVGDQSSRSYTLYQYDSNGRALSVKEVYDDEIVDDSERSYENGVLASSGDFYFVTERDGQGRITRATWFDNWHFAFEYDENGNVTKVSYELESGDGTVYAASLSIGYEKVYDPTPLVRTLGGNILV